jgi:hypothetical protein
MSQNCKIKPNGKVRVTYSIIERINDVNVLIIDFLFVNKGKHEQQVLELKHK